MRNIMEKDKEARVWLARFHHDTVIIERCHGSHRYFNTLVHDLAST